VQPTAVWASKVLPGILRVALEETSWELIHSGYTADTERLFEVFRIFEADGVIGFLGSAVNVRRMPASVRAVVNISNRLANPPVPSVLNDDVAAGHLAADHLLAAGFHHLAYYGYPGEHFSRLRRRGLVERANARRVRAHVFRSPHDPYTRWDHWLHDVARWMRRLPDRTGILASDDGHATDLLNLASKAGRAIPAELGVMGVNNDSSIRSFLDGISLSSVELDYPTVGIRAARLLQRILGGERIPRRHRELVAPIGVVVRSSTDRRFAEGPVVGRAVQLIESDIAHPWRVDELAGAVHVSRRMLERQFAAALGHSPKEEIDAIRLRHARSLLVDPAHTISEIAAACGFDEPRGLTLLFRRRLGLTPSGVRAQLQKAAKAR